MKKSRIKKGFTLVETLLYIALTSLILSSAVTVFYQLTKDSLSIENQDESNAEALFLMERTDNLLDSGMIISGSSSIVTDEPIMVENFKIASSEISFSIGSNTYSFIHY